MATLGYFNDLWSMNKSVMIWLIDIDIEDIFIVNNGARWIFNSGNMSALGHYVFDWRLSVIPSLILCLNHIPSIDCTVIINVKLMFHSWSLVYAWLANISTCGFPIPLSNWRQVFANSFHSWIYSFYRCSWSILFSLRSKNKSFYNK